MLKNYIKSTSVFVESKNKSLVEGVLSLEGLFLC